MSGTIIGRFLTRAASGTKHRIESKPLRHPVHPIFASKRLTAVHATPQRLQVALAFRPIDAAYPVLRQIDGPLRQNRPTFLVSKLASPKARPLPLFGTFAQPGTQSIPLHITARPSEIFVGLHQERLETSLVHVAGAYRSPMGVPALGVRQRQPTNER